MMKRNCKIRVMPSEELAELRLFALVGKTGTIIEDLSFDGRKNKGYMVLFPESFLNENIWYIPIESIKYEE
ncbi:hypothetical protein [Dysgonomonas sp. 520]|uniref:hypothetical protein n=1 Tax=Dysgonomonas sp. 520 TaxID=2302931 RepID=UPI0013D4330B|nr:hypothetical protein [Dysgonomonas sp. 520]NDW09934.1 hypothetical protein [Dysgonomonas sp. 520]